MAKESKSAVNRIRFGVLWALTVCCFLTMLLVGCTGHILPRVPYTDEIRSRDFIIVTTRTGDTLATLARTHLGDSGRAWQIAVFNGVESVRPGDRLVVPIKPVDPGGLTANGYQIVPVLAFPPVRAVNPGDRKHRADRDGSAALPLPTFIAEMQYLMDNGYAAISLNDLHRFLAFSDSLPPKAVVLSFDTEGRWFYDQVFPVLKHLGFSAALFISPPAIGRPEAMDWANLRELAATGIDIGIRGRAISERAAAGEKTDERWKGIEKELTVTTTAVATGLNHSCPFFAYGDDGDADDLMIASLKQHGFILAFTHKPGANPFFADDFRLHRNVIKPATDMADFQKAVSVFHGAEKQ
jgi:hypothetical protein